MRLPRLPSMFRRPNERERSAQERYRASLERAVKVMPGDEKLRQLLKEADLLMKDAPRG